MHMMKALLKTNNKVTIAHVADQPLKSGYVKIKVKQVGLCRTDLLVASGHISTSDNLVLGHEFSGIILEDSTGQYHAGQKVAVNPFFAIGSMMGLNFDGCLREVIHVPLEQVVPFEADISFKKAAYLEPLAASLAVLNVCKDKQIKGAIFGNNRIAELTYLILKKEGFNVEWLDEHKPYYDNTFDYIVETLFEQPYIDNMCHMLKPGGTLVVKSRQHKGMLISSALMVAKELTLKCVNYYNFHDAMQWLVQKGDCIDNLLGESYAIDAWEDAFMAAKNSEKKKIFIHLNEDIN